MSEIEFSSNSTVTLYKCNASDLDVARAAWVSQNTQAHEKESDEGRVERLINFLYKNEHNCYDAQTEVLTSKGWRYFDELNGSEFLASLNLEKDVMEFAPCERVVSFDFDGAMLHWNGAQSDILVTPNHNMVASKRGKTGFKPFALIPAEELTSGHKIRLGGGNGVLRSGNSDFSIAAAKFVGFFIGDGHLKTKTSVDFRIKRSRKVQYLEEICSVLGLPILKRPHNTYTVSLKESETLLDVIKQTYTKDLKQKVIPAIILDSFSKAQLEAVWDGLKNSDGTETKGGSFGYISSSYTLISQIQALLAMIGSAGTVSEKVSGNENHFTTWRLHEQGRNKEPKFNVSRQHNRVEKVHYTGKVWCATNKNGTLYVRRNGKPCWSGNSPFEHGSFTFIVETPIFVAREFMRSRTMSYNEVSGRYVELKPKFYIPSSSRAMRQEGKVGNYTFVEDKSLAESLVQPALENNALDAWESYQTMLAAGVAKEVARNVLPVNLFTTFWATVNPRNLMHFLNLRTDETALFEIRDVANQMEAILKEEMPMVYSAWKVLDAQ